MKKIVTSILSIAAAVSVVGTVASCGGDGEKSPVTTVNGEQWTAAFASDNFASDFKASASVSDSAAGQTTREDFTFTVGPEKFGNHSFDVIGYTNGQKSSQSEIITVFGADLDTVYSRYYAKSGDGDEWIAGEWESEQRTHSAYTADEWEDRVLRELGIAYLCKLADEYDSFSYTDGAYVLQADRSVTVKETSFTGDDYTSASKVTATDVTVKFSDGKVVYAEMKVHYVSDYSYSDQPSMRFEGDGNIEINITYGGQSVAAPTAE